MGLSSKQVSSNGLDWNRTLMQAQNLEFPKPPPMMRRQQQQQNQQQSEPIKCPRCDSTNTKFCYYNNYNKSQPRHFCRTCKRHWTKGGTLRNVPVGGGRKNKRVKKPTPTTTSSTAAAAATAVATTSIIPTISSMDNRVNTRMTIQNPQQKQNLNPLAIGDQKSLSGTFYQTLLRPPSLLTQQNLMTTSNIDSRASGSGNRMFLHSSLSFPQSLPFPFQCSSTSFDTNPSSITPSFQPSNVYNYGTEEFRPSLEETANNTLMGSSSSNAQTWQIPTTTGSEIDMSNNWNWEDIDSLVSTDLNLPWEDSDIKP